MKKSTPEGHVLRSVLEYLAVKKIWCMRMNTGSIVSTYKGKTRLLKFGRPGCADILASPKVSCEYFDPEVIVRGPQFLWIEVKAPKGVQSDLQKEFQAEVETEGHGYLVARSIEDVEAWISLYS